MNSSHESDDDDYVAGRDQHVAGRKDIRRIKSFAELLLDTKLAKYEEVNRKLRIADYEKGLEHNFPNGEAMKKMILDFDDGTKEPIVTVHPQLVAHLKDHQKEGIRFMWKVCFERVSKLTERGTGCILAHCMGLGKTFQIIALIYTILTNPKINLTKILIIAPKNTILNWVHEFNKWIQPPLTRIYVFNPSRGDKFKICDIETWYRIGGVCILSYSKFRLLIEESGKDSNIQKCLLNPGPDFVVCDEGHVIKNFSTKLAKAFTGLMTTRRVVLSGTPLQNNLLEYYTMVNFVRPFLLGAKGEFRNMFENPIKNGQYHDSLIEDVNLMKARSHVLHRTLTSCVQRFDLTTLSSFLLDKREFVLCVRLTDGQKATYAHFLEKITNVRETMGTQFETKLFADFQALQRIWSHPYSLQLYDERPPARPKKTTGIDFDDDLVLERPQFWIPGWWREFTEPAEIETKEASAKLVVLFEIIEHCLEKREKLLIFSQSLFSLNLIEHFLNKDRDDGVSGWVAGIDYFVLTGQSTAEKRHEMCQQFNNPENEQMKVFLISTKAGGLGITLNAANRAVIFDACWNPSHDIQSIFRIYRLGQKRQCYIYRLVASGTMEEKIYERQVMKQSTSHRVVDEKQIARHYTQNEINDLYEFIADKFYVNSDILHKDELLEKIVRKHTRLVGGYHEHDSLLQHKMDEELLEMEKNDAWTGFGDESNDDVAGAVAVGKMISLEAFKLNNFKIVLRRTYPHLPETAISTLVTELMPRVKEIFRLPNFESLMTQEALRASITEKAKANADTMRRHGSKPQPLRQWGVMGGRHYGNNETDSD